MHRNTPNRVQWEIPGGKIETNETPWETAKREVREELNIEVYFLKELGNKIFQEDSFVMNYTWFLVKIISGVPKIMEKKFDDIKYFSKGELLNVSSSLSPNTKNFITHCSDILE